MSSYYSSWERVTEVGCSPSLPSLDLLSMKTSWDYSFVYLNQGKNDAKQPLQCFNWLKIALHANTLKNVFTQSVVVSVREIAIVYSFFSWPETLILTLDSRHIASLNCWTGEQQELRIWNEDWGNFVFSPPSSPVSSDAKICQAVHHFDMSGAVRCEQSCPVVTASPEITFSQMGPTFTCCENKASQDYQVMKQNNNIFFNYIFRTSIEIYYFGTSGWLLPINLFVNA